MYDQVLSAWSILAVFGIAVLSTTAVNRFVRLRSELVACTGGTNQYRYELREEKETPTDAKIDGYDLSQNEHLSLADDDNASAIVRWPTWAQEVMFVAESAAFDSEAYGVSWM